MQWLPNFTSSLTAVCSARKRHVRLVGVAVVCGRPPRAPVLSNDARFGQDTWFFYAVSHCHWIAGRFECWLGWVEAD